MPENKPSWFSTGYSGIKPEVEKMDMQNGPDRVWIPPGQKKELIFLDDLPACIHEHCPKIDGDWKNWITCLKDVYEEAPCCELLNSSGYKSYYVGYFTVVDCSKWVDKQGKEYCYGIKLFPAKLKTLKRLQMRRDERGPFAGKVFSISRLDEKSPATGDDFEMVRDADLTKLFQVVNYRGKKLVDEYAKAVDEDSINRLKNIFQLEMADGKVVPKLVPFNYGKLLYPLAPKDVRVLLNSSKIEQRDDKFGGGDGGGTAPAGGGTTDNAIPF